MFIDPPNPIHVRNAQNIKKMALKGSTIKLATICRTRSGKNIWSAFLHIEIKAQNVGEIEEFKSTSSKNQGAKNSFVNMGE
jgi:hypothetical protein